jgi:transposase
MSQKERQRHHLLQMVTEGRITLIEASQKMVVSYRHAKRLKKRFLQQGAKALVHGNRGRTPPNALKPETRKQVIDLAQQRYSAFNDTHFTEALQVNEGLKLGRETVRQLLRQAGIKPKRKRRPKKHHRRRERKTREGLMLLWDGSPHRWFGPTAEPCCLMAAVDDATSNLVAARFVDAESSHAYLCLLQDIVSIHGLPAAIYQDRHSALYNSHEPWSLQEQLDGRKRPTQVGAALEALGIQAIFAHSPQAKGRIERAFGTLQDRLLAELDLQGITDIDSANAFLVGFIERYNRRFGVEAKNGRSAWRKPSRDLDLDRIISLSYPATVANDNTVRQNGLVIDIPPGPKGRSYAQAEVDLRQMLDGSWRVYYQNRVVASHHPTKVGEPIRTLRRRQTKGAKPETWVYIQSANINQGDIFPRHLRGHIDSA